MTTNDDSLTPEELNKRANEEWKNIHESQPGQIAGEKSSIPSLLDDKAKKQSLVEGIIGDLANQRSEIDGVKQMIQLLTEQQNQMAAMINQQTQAINQLAGGSQVQPGVEGQQGIQGLNMDSIVALGEVAEKLVHTYKSLKGNDAPPPAQLISQEYINEKMKNSVMENFELGETILGAVKDTLKKKAVKNIVDTAIPKGDLTGHEPQ